jgi:hypothetical protein
MAVEIFHCDAIAQDRLTPAMRFLLTKWNTLSLTNKLSLPALTENTTFNIADNAAYMIPAGDDFFYMHFGKNVAAAVGQDFTGRLMVPVNDTVAHDLRDAYRQAGIAGKPLFLRYTTEIARNALIWERLVLPVPVEGLGQLLVCYSEVLSHHQDVFEYLFHKARNAWIVTYPIFRGEDFDDGWILLMNDAARAAFSYDRPIRSLRLREFKLFQFPELWERLRESYARADPRASVGFDELDLELFKVKQLLAFRFDRSAMRLGKLS